jgi:hypothetical protein
VEVVEMESILEGVRVRQADRQQSECQPDYASLFHGTSMIAAPGLLPKQENVTV